MAQALVTRAVRKTNTKSTNPWFTELPKLELMLWGGTLMLVIDHIISGEVTFAYPFFTALASEGGLSMMLHEMLTTGLAMSVAVTLIYVARVLYLNYSLSRTSR